MKTISLLSVVAALVAFAGSANGQGTAFNYQGALSQNGAPANGAHDLTFTLFTAASGGIIVGPTNVFNDLQVSNGLFTVLLDFGPSAFIGADRWLEIAVRPGASTGNYTNLVPRQPIMAVPYALHARSVNAAGIIGQIVGNQIGSDTVSSAKLAPGYQVNGQDLYGGINLLAGGGQAQLSVTFIRPFAVGTVPNIDLPAGWTVTGSSANGFTATTPFSTTTASPPANVGGHFSLAMVGDFPAIAYNDDNPEILKYVRMRSADTSDWGTPVNVLQPVNFFSRGYKPSLAMVNGAPAIVSHSSNDRILAFTRANDGTGATWASPLTVDGAGWFGCLRAVNGVPAISYQRMISLLGERGDLAYAYGNDASGSSFTTMLLDTSGGNTAISSSLAVVAGVPAISYANPFNSATDVLKFIRADDAVGTVWGSAVMVASGEGIRENSLEVVNGRPAIAYRQGAELRYVRAGDATGTIWPSSIVIGAADAFQDISLIFLNSRPVIAFTAGGLAKMVVARDAEGTQWGTPFSLGSGRTSNRAIVGVGGQILVAHDGGAMKFSLLPTAPVWSATAGGSVPLFAQAAVSASSLQLPGAAGEGGLRVEAPVSGDTDTANLIGGFSGNSIATGAAGSVIAGGGFAGSENSIGPDGRSATVSGGEANTAGGAASTIGGGAHNTASGSGATVGGGGGNAAIGLMATVPGGNANQAAGSYSFAAGRRAKANHEGVFAWADSQDADFISSGTNQFLIRASGGVGIGLTRPLSPLHVYAPYGNSIIAESWLTNPGGVIGKNSYCEWFTGAEGLDWVVYENHPDPALRLIVKTGGHMGVGTDSPGTRLQLGDFETSGDEFVTLATAGGNQYRAGLLLRHFNSEYGWSIVSDEVDSRLKIFSHFANAQGQERLTIDRFNGNVGIGVINPSATLDVGGDMRLPETSALSFGGGAYISADISVMRIQANNVGIGMEPNGASGVRLQVGGTASKTTAGDWLANSDRRIKTNITTLDSNQALEKLRAVRPVAFEYTEAYRKAHPTIEPRPYLNVIAQEFAETFPDWVRSSGEPVPGTEGKDPKDQILQVDTYPLTIYSAAAIKALDASDMKQSKSIETLGQKLDGEVKALRAENASLKRRLDKLEQLLTQTLDTAAPTASASAPR